MATKYFALLTNIGAAKLANATALGAQVEITQMAVGDGNGALPTPNPAQTTLTHELRRAQLNMLTIDPVNTNQIIAEQVIPEDVGGWWIREIGLFDKDGDMIAIANCAETYKPQLQEGSGRVQVIRVILIVSNTEAVTLKIDPSVVLATRGYVDNLIETRQQKSDTLTALAALKPAKGKLPYFTAEKAAALADLSDFIRLMLNKGDAAGVLEYLRLGAGAPAIGIPFFWPSSAMPNTVMTEWADMVFLKFNGATFSAATYPKLALVIPSLTLPDARGEFPRIWDDGRGVDSGRALLSTQGDAVQRMTGSLSQMVYSIAQQASDINGAFSATSGTPNIVQAYSSAGALRYMNVSFDTQNVVRTSTETRSRNIAFNFLVRAK